MKDITVFYTNGKNVFETCVTYETVEVAIKHVKEELEEGYTVLEKETKERFLLDNM